MRGVAAARPGTSRELAQGLRGPAEMATRQTQRKRVSAVVVPEEDLFDRLVHDLRNPLGVIAYFAEAVATASEAEHGELCARLRINSQRALHVLEEFSLLADLRSGAGQRQAEQGDVAELIADLVAELESMERRAGRIRCQVELAQPRSASRPHLTAALRALLRVALRVAATDDTVDLAVREEGRQIDFLITVPLRTDPEIGVSARLPSRGIEIELAERVASRFGGRYTLDVRPGNGVMSVRLPLAR